VNNKETMPPAKVRASMRDLLLWLAEQRKKKLHPFISAADFYARFEYIYPFADGNGRVGRLLFIWMLLKTGYGVMLFKNKNRQSYFSALSQADKGRSQKLYRHCFHVYQETVKELNLRKIENIYCLIIENLGVDHGLRKQPVGIVGTKYKPLDNIYQIREAVEEMIKVVNKLKSPLVKALAATLLIAYIQPFGDGKKRISRILGNAILLVHGFCPLSYRSINEAAYKKAVILFYEQNSAGFFKELFIEQFRFSIENYFLA